MVDFRKVSVVVPVYNEEKTISEVIERIFKVSSDFEVIVCSDGSIDKTAVLAKESGAVVIEHPYNLGNGASIKSGARRSSRKYIVFIDADLQHQPEDIPKLLEHMPGYDMVIGARTNKSRTKLYRNIGNKVLTGVAESISGYKIDDLTSGFRVVKKDIFLKFAHLYPARYSYPSTSTLAFFCSGCFVKYVPLSSIGARKQGDSNILPLKDGMRFLHIIVRIIMTFHPQKIFLPLSLFLFFFGFLIALYQIVNSGAIRSSGIIFLISSLVVFLNGLLAEQLSQLRRELNK
jgi:glycosyltransferase involved in cell wall biosynthesis